MNFLYGMILALCRLLLSVIMGLIITLIIVLSVAYVRLNNEMISRKRDLMEIDSE